MATISDDTIISGTLRVIGGVLPEVPRSNLQQDDLKAFNIPLTTLRVWDAFGTVLPGTSAADDLGIYGQSYATGAPYVGTYDVQAAGAVTLYARFGVQVPHNYVPGETALIRFHAGMITTVADVSATLDLQAYLSNRGTDSLITGSDLVTTSATSINSTTFANKDFTLTTTNLRPGSYLDCRVTIATNDGSGGSVTVAAFTNLELVCDVQG